MKRYKIVFETNKGVPVKITDEFESIDSCFNWSLQFMENNSSIICIASIELV